MQIEVMDWPPISPDLNPIENLWTLLKQKIYELRPELIHMRNNDETKELLVATAQEVQNLLDWTHLENLSATMPHRVEAIIESQGWYTPYQQIEMKSMKVQTGRILCNSGGVGQGGVQTYGPSLYMPSWNGVIFFGLVLL